MITSGDGVEDDMRKELRSPQVRTGFESLHSTNFFLL